MVSIVIIATKVEDLTCSLGLTFIVYVQLARMEYLVMLCTRLQIFAPPIVYFVVLYLVLRVCRFHLDSF